MTPENRTKDLLKLSSLNQQGFGFLSVVILVTIMAAVGSIVLVTLDTTVDSGAVAQTGEKMDVVIDAISKYQVDTGIDPATIDDLVTDAAGVGACSSNTATSKMENWCGPYVDIVFQEDLNDFKRDGWGANFVFDIGADNTPGNGTLTSNGPDGAAGGGDDITLSF